MTEFRTAAREDAPLILDMIKALADYEKEPHLVDCQVDDLLRDGFGDAPYFECLLAFHEGEPAGFALYYFTWSTWTGRPGLFLQDLFVTPAHRGLKIGLGLLQRLAAIAVERNCARMEWEVLDWNMLARDFYHRIGARCKETWLPYRMDGEALRALAAGEQSGHP